jgi:hypothetical protein
MSRLFCLSLALQVMALGCLPEKERGAGLSRYPDSESLEGPQSGSLSFQAAFEASVYPIARQECAVCHGGAQVPLFAVSDALAALLPAEAKADFLSPRNSGLVARAALAGHCPSCGPALGAEMEAAIVRWDLLWNGLD